MYDGFMDFLYDTSDTPAYTNSPHRQFSNFDAIAATPYDCFFGVLPLILDNQ